MHHRIVFLTLIAMTCSVASAQFGGNGPGGGGGQGGNPGGGVGGIRINADGLVEQAIVKAGSVRDLKAELKKSADALPTELHSESESRKVSLAKLDEALRSIRGEGGEVPTEMRSFAGLTRIDAVMIAEDGSDIIVAGPAEPFAVGRDGRVIGIDTGRPVLCLDDLLVALRSSSPGSSVGCSFDPDPDRLVATRTAMQSEVVAANRAAAERGFEDHARTLGNWNVTVMGVPGDSRMAVSMVEADFLLKRLTTGAEKTGLRGFKSQLAMMKPGDDAMRRWWFSPAADVLQRDPDGRLFRLHGQRLRVSAQEELVDANGNRSDAPVNSESLEEYARQFTDKLPELAEKYAALSHLQNLVDVLVLSAIMRDTARTGALSWQPEFLMNDAALPSERFEVPKETPSIATVRAAGSRTIIGLIAGGVVISPDAIVRDAETATLDTIPSSDATHWWWD